MKANYYFGFTILVLLLFLTSCQDKINIEQINCENKLLVYSFPTNKDTIPIIISPAISINKQPKEIKNIAVSCFTDGKEDNIIFISNESVSSIPCYTYYAIGKHNIGNRIEISVKADNYTPAYGETTIPEETSIKTSIIDTIFYKGNQYTQIKLSINKQKHGYYYATRILVEEGEEGFTKHKFQEIETSLEPLLNGYTNTDIKFGTWNNYYHQMYTFKENYDIVNNDSLSLRLCVQQRPWLRKYQAQVFNITKDYYLFLKSLNDIENNEIGGYGLSLISSSYSNIKGGYGCIGGYTFSKTTWIK